jgi:hypothetical protein
MTGGYVESRKYMDREIYSFGAGEVSPALSASDSMLVFGLQGEIVEKIIRRIGKNLPGIGDSDGFKKHAAFLPSRVSSLSYSTQDYLGQTISEAIKSAAENTGEEMPAEILALIEAMGKTLGASMGYAVWKDEGLYGDSVMYYNK